MGSKRFGNATVHESLERLKKIEPLLAHREWAK
jgi:hypothetical protein